LVQARWADASGVERVPDMAAVTKPSVFLAGRPAAERAADARIRGTFALLFVEFTIQNNGRFGSGIREGAHAPASPWIGLFQFQQGGPKQVVIL
jgi:hypothetical protein